MAPIFSLVALTLALAVPQAVNSGDLEREAREIEAMLIAPCCFSQQVSVHHSPAADEVRTEVRLRLAAGETRDQILDAYVQRYGARILAEPPAEGFNRFLYVLPPLALAATALFIVVLVRRFTSRGSDAGCAEETSPAPAAEARYGAELDDQLRNLD